MKRYMMVGDWLPDGRYKSSGKLRWHEKLRLNLALWLFESVRKPNDLEIRTTTGVAMKRPGVTP